MRATAKFSTGMTLIELLIAAAILLVAFLSFYALFEASLRYVSSARAREAAISLATERMEAMRAMKYDDIGTVGGIPAGSIPQNETISLDNVTFNRRTFVQYVDDPADGIGAADQNNIAADYKRAKVEVSWPSTAGTSSVSLITNFIPHGTESVAGGGTLLITVIDASAAPVPQATVHIVNSSAVPPIDFTTRTDATTGEVVFPGSPAASSYEITVSRNGYSTAQTYPVSASNPNPNPGDLTVLAGQTTNPALSIDVLASLTVRTWNPPEPATTTEPLDTGANIVQATNAEVSGGALVLAQDTGGNYYAAGSARSAPYSPAVVGWRMFSWHSDIPTGTAALLHLYTQDGAGGYTLIPDSVLPGNAAGFSASPVDISALPTATYPSLVVGADLSTSDPAATPAILDWSLSSVAPRVGVGNKPFDMHGTKNIGTTGSGSVIYKLIQSLSTDSGGEYVNGALEWDSYTLAPSGGTLAASCPLEPVPVSPGSSVTADLYLTAASENSLLVTVTDAVSGKPISGATVALSRGGYAASVQSDACGEVLFGGLASAADYKVSVSAAGHTTSNQTAISVSGQSADPVALTP